MFGTDGSHTESSLGAMIGMWHPPTAPIQLGKSNFVLYPSTNYINELPEGNLMNLIIAMRRTDTRTH